MSFLSRNTHLSAFPTYILPSLPFRRRKASNDSTASTDSTNSTSSVPSSDGPDPSSYLSGHHSHLRCARCAADLCSTAQIISKGFTGRHGRAYLVSAEPVGGISPTATAKQNSPSLPNTHTLKPVPRQLVTGAHTVSDVSCAFCGSVLGWKYVAAEEEAQRYKVGKFILETKRICAMSNWEGEDDGDVELVREMPPASLGGSATEEVEFDSQDEDECEDLFAGVWSPSLALKRRQGKRFDREMRERTGSEL